MDTQQMVSLVATKLAALLALTTTPAILFTGKIHLYANAYTPTENSLLADFIEATFTGYLPIAWGTWGTPYIGIDGQPHVTAPSLQWQPTDAVTPNTIYGIFATNTAGTTLLWAAAFVAPIPLPSAEFAVVYEPDFIYGP